jgi:hypothetical protein
MENFRQFEAGPDPFGRTWDVRLKWMQTAISIRHSDSVDARFLMESEGEQQQKLISLPHARLIGLSQEAGLPMTDAWCCRLAALHLKHIVESGEDLEKDLVTPSLEQLRGYNEELKSAGLTQALPY